MSVGVDRAAGGGRGGRSVHRRVPGGAGRGHGHDGRRTAGKMSAAAAERNAARAEERCAFKGGGRAGGCEYDTWEERAVTSWAPAMPNARAPGGRDGRGI